MREVLFYHVAWGTLLSPFYAEALHVHFVKLEDFEKTHKEI